MESEVKQALDRGLRALIHHLITSAACVSVLSQPSLCVFPVLCLHVARMFACVHEPACLCISCVSSQQTDAIICMEMFPLLKFTAAIHHQRSPLSSDGQNAGVSLRAAALTNARSARRWLCSRMNGTRASARVGGVNAGHRAEKLTG